MCRMAGQNNNGQRTKKQQERQRHAEAGAGLSTWKAVPPESARAEASQKAERASHPLAALTRRVFLKRNPQDEAAKGRACEVAVRGYTHTTAQKKEERVVESAERSDLRSFSLPVARNVRADR